MTIITLNIFLTWSSTKGPAGCSLFPPFLRHSQRNAPSISPPLQISISFPVPAFVAPGLFYFNLFYFTCEEVGRPKRPILRESKPIISMKSRETTYLNGGVLKFPLQFYFFREAASLLEIFIIDSYIHSTIYVLLIEKNNSGNFQDITLNSFPKRQKSMMIRSLKQRRKRENVVSHFGFRYALSLVERN